MKEKRTTQTASWARKRLEKTIMLCKLQTPDNQSTYRNPNLANPVTTENTALRQDDASRRDTTDATFNIIKAGAKTSGRLHENSHCFINGPAGNESKLIFSTAFQKLPWVCACCATRPLATHGAALKARSIFSTRTTCFATKTDSLEPQRGKILLHTPLRCLCWQWTHTHLPAHTRPPKAQKRILLSPSQIRVWGTQWSDLGPKRSDPKQNHFRRSRFTVQPSRRAVRCVVAPHCCGPHSKWPRSQRRQPHQSSTKTYKHEELGPFLNTLCVTKMPKIGLQELQ